MSSQLRICVLCGEARHLDDLTLGMYLDSQQALACNSHFFDSDRLYRGWATFVVTQYKEVNKSTAPAEKEMYDARPALY